MVFSESPIKIVRRLRDEAFELYHMMEYWESRFCKEIKYGQTYWFFSWKKEGNILLLVTVVMHYN